MDLRRLRVGGRRNSMSVVDPSALIGLWTASYSRLHGGDSDTSSEMTAWRGAASRVSDAPCRAWFRVRRSHARVHA